MTIALLHTFVICLAETTETTEKYNTPGKGCLIKIQSSQPREQGNALFETACWIRREISGSRNGFGSGMYFL
jgi:hypothetical protein